MGRAGGPPSAALDPLCTGEAPPGEPWAQLVQTHTSIVVLVGDRAYKVKKPVRLPFVDLTTPSRRLRNCRSEVRLNRRFARDVYLGVLQLRGRGAPCRVGEPVVAMRRMPADRRLSALLVRGRTDLAARCVDDVARRVATAHAAEPGLDNYRLWPTMRALWREGYQQMTGFVDLLHSPPDAAAAPGARDPVTDDGSGPLEEVALLAEEYLRGRRPLLDSRERRGLVRDGHGDLLADDIFMLDDGARILDCLEFDRRLRLGDVLADVAFLAMDLDWRGAPDLARALIDRYRQYTGETHPLSLEHHYVAYRAFVRSKIACLRHRQGLPEAAQQARGLLELCRHRLRQGRVHLVLVGGLPGSGKSTLARALVTGDRGREWALLSSDVLRKELAGQPPERSCAAAFAEGLYSPGWTARTYAELERRATLALGAGVNAVLDASWTDATHRQAARQLAAAHGAALSEVRCRAPTAVCLARLAARAAAGPRTASDADADVHVRMDTLQDPWPEALDLDTDRPVACSLDDLLSALATGRRTRG